MFKYLVKIKTISFFLIVLIFQILLVIMLNLLNVDFGESSMKNVPILYIFLLVVIIAPFIETLLFNTLPIKIIQYFIKNKYIIILLSSIVFALIHTYSVAYIFMTYFGAISINTFYLVTEEKKGLLKASGLTVLLHSVYNLIGFLLIEIFHVY